MFHAFQHEGDYYNEDTPKPLSTIETEGDVATLYVMGEAKLGMPTFGDWNNEIFFDYLGNDTPSLSRIQSSKYQSMFQRAVDARISYYKTTGMNVPTYTAPNRGIKPKALEGAIRLIK